MPPVPKQIKLHVSTNDRSNGVLNIKITPWKIHLDAGDVVEWIVDAEKPKNDIKWFRVEQTEAAKPWPFVVQPPDPSYTGSDTAGVTATRKGAAIGDVISYGLTIGFDDDTGNHRKLSIDPDMVIET